MDDIIITADNQVLLLSDGKRIRWDIDQITKAFESFKDAMDKLGIQIKM